MRAYALSAQDIWTKEPFEVVIAYDTVVAGKRAMDLFSNLQREVGFRIQPWPFDLIIDPEWRTVATGEAIKAELLTISSSQTELPPEVRKWLLMCRTRKRGTHGAVVALLGNQGRTRGFDSLDIRYLCEASKEAGLDFFAPVGTNGQRRDTQSSSDQERIPSFSSVQSLDRFEGYPHWGIND